jgi:glutathione S-transferase
MIHVYGKTTNRTFRTYWMLEELGLPYESSPLDTQAGETRTEEFLRINPNGHVPTLVDGETVVWESMAINLFLARKYGGELATTTPEDDAIALQWSFWAMTEVEGQLLEYGMNTQFLPEAERDPKLASEAQEHLGGALAVLDTQLASQSYLAGEHFGVVDLNVAAVLSWTRLTGFDTSAFTNLDRWLGTCLERPAAQRVSAQAS